MQNKLLLSTCAFFFATLFLAYSAFAQYTSQILNTSYCIGDSIHSYGRVSSLSDDRIISFHSNSTQSEFHCTDYNTGPHKHFGIPANMVIYDIETYNGLAYFCGTYKDSAIVGYFPEYAFDYGFITEDQPVPITLPYPVTSIPFKYAVFSEVNIMDKIEIYVSSNDEAKIAAVGRMKDPESDATTCIFLIYDFNTYFNYDFFSINATKYGAFQDIAATEDYIISSGNFNISGADKIAISVIDKTNTSPFNTYFFDENAGDMKSYYYSIEAMNGNNVAVSTTVDNQLSGLQIPVYVYDAGQGDITNVQVFPISVCNSCREEMLYIEEDNSLLLLHTNNLDKVSFTTTEIHELFPYSSSPYLANYIYNPSTCFVSLDKFQDSRFLATGNYSSGANAFLLHNRQSGMLSSCFTTSQKSVSLISHNLDSKSTPSFSNKSTPFINIFPEVMDCVVEDKCISK